jgi:transposase
MLISCVTDPTQFRSGRQFAAWLGLTPLMINSLAEQAIEAQDRIRQLERDLLAWFRSNDLARRIATVPGVGLLGTSALAATVRALARAAETLARGSNLHGISALIESDQHTKGMLP